MNKGKIIRERRQAIDMTLEEVAVKVGTSKQTIQRYESGVISNIPSDMIEKLADVLQTTPAVLMGWEDTEKKKAAPIDEALITSDVIRQALGNLTEEQYQDVLEFARFLKTRRDGK